MLSAWKFRRSDSRPGESSGKARMRLRSGIVIVSIGALLLTACSEEKKREAARLAAQLEGDTVAFADSIAAIDRAASDSMRADSVHESLVAEQDTPPQSVDTSTGRSQTDMPSRDTTSPTPVEQTVHLTDSIIPDINAIPTENGQTRPKTMPRYIEDAYTVQVASSTDQAFSQEVVDTFLARGYDAYLGTVTHDGTTYYRVRVGRYTSPTAANETAVEINHRYDLQSWVDKITK